MISPKTLKTLEYDKIMANVSSFAILEKTKQNVLSFLPSSDFKQIEFLLNKTRESYKLLYTYNVNPINYCEDLDLQLTFAEKGGTLNNSELLKVALNLKSARIFKNSVDFVKDESIVFITEIANRLYLNQEIESEITSKIISEEEISDNASDKLYSIRKSIRNINASIRDKLNSYMRGGMNKYLQDSVVTLRQNRYVVPVKSEYRSYIKGFIHDQSSSGATVYVEPEQVMELNNELKKAMLDEVNEINRILSELSSKVASIAGMIRYNFENLVEIDEAFCRAQYSFKTNSTMPIINQKGIVNIKGGRHPLIDSSKVVPVDISLGENFNFLLITGPNTGGKTVTLKLVGLMTLLAMSGLYIPAYDDSDICIFNNIFCDIGDEQSIEQNLSTFSSHIKNLIDIINNVDTNSLILIDEIGAGTDPDEGSALALAIIKKFISKNCYGIITTHYSLLKEFAMTNPKLSNASMQFDINSLKPLYKLLIGIPGSSNALNIAKTLGLDSDILSDALENLSKDKIDFENVLQSAEKSRREAEKLQSELVAIKRQKEAELSELIAEKDRVVKERENINFTAKQQVKHIVAEKLEDAEEIISNLKALLNKSNLENRDIFKASELKNRLKNSAYLINENVNAPIELKNVDIDNLRINDNVYVKSLDSYCKIISINKNKKEAEVLLGGIKSIIKISDIFNNEKTLEKNKKVSVSRKTSASYNFIPEINVIGKSLLEALDDVEYLIDRAIILSVEEIKIIHGVGEGILLKGIRDMLKTDKRVKQFRRGKYGEGENGVTIVTLK